MKDEIVRSLQRLRIRKVRAVPLRRPCSSRAIRTAQQRGPARGPSSLALPGAVCHHFGFRWSPSSLLIAHRSGFLFLGTCFFVSAEPNVPPDALPTVSHVNRLTRAFPNDRVPCTHERAVSRSSRCIPSRVVFISRRRVSAIISLKQYGSAGH